MVGFKAMRKIIIIVLLGQIVFWQARAHSQEQTISLPQKMQLPKQQVVPKLAADQFAQPLEIFGHNLFLLPERVKKDVGAGGMILPGDYRLGAGDRLAIYLLGKIQQNFDVIVNVEGKIYIPTVGVFYVAGLTIKRLQSFLEKRLSKYYDNFSLNLMLIEPRYIPVFVVGDVKRPGKYFVSALNSVLDVVILAGGPTDVGSLRNIQVFRDDRLLKTVDLYQFLVGGTMQNQVLLQQYDRIVVPLIRDIVTITGEVKRQAKFELKNDGKERLSDLVELAGGFTDLAFIDKIEISRLLPDGQRRVFYVDYHKILANDSCAANIVLKNDDRIHVFSILDQSSPQYVYIHGEVKHPGKYLLEENLHVADLILKAGNLTRSAYLLEGEVAKIDPKMPTKFRKINIQQVLNHPESEQNILLEEDDRVFIRQIPESLSRTAPG